MEKAEIAAQDAETIGSSFDRGLISQQTALKELRQLSQVTGRFSNITDEEINDADPELPDPSEIMAGQQAEGNEAVPEAEKSGE
jgi:hypothetical protein